MRFRRKAGEVEDIGLDEVDATQASAEAEGELAATGPFDAEDLPEGAPERVDLGSLLITPSPGRELRIQVDQASGAVQSVVLAGPDGALELRAFAAPRGGDLWSEVMPQIAAEVKQSGGTSSEAEGPFGAELVCEMNVDRPGGSGKQTSRVIGVNGSRWMLRATLMGRPATDADVAAEWEDAIRSVAVRRGEVAMPVGEALPLTMPPQARRVEK